MAPIRPPVKIHGGKFYLARWVLSFFPKTYRSHHYFEPFAGAGSVLLQKERPHTGYIEGLNDVDSHLMVLYRYIQDQPNRLIGLLRQTVYSLRTFESAVNTYRTLASDDTRWGTLDHAVAVYTMFRMSRGGMGKNFSWSDRPRGGMAESLNAWNTSIDNLHAVANRLQNVMLSNTTATSLIRTINDWPDANKVLLYCDPPYMPTTRASERAYGYEMSVEAHEQLAYHLTRFKGKVLLSGYPTKEYRSWFKTWDYETLLIANHASQAKAKRRMPETVWRNF